MSTKVSVVATVTTTDYDEDDAVRSFVAHLNDVLATTVGEAKRLSVVSRPKVQYQDARYVGKVTIVRTRGRVATPSA
jgi:hypothetical protein